MTLSNFVKSAAIAWPLALGGTVGLGLIAAVSLPQGIAFAEEAGQRVPESMAKSTETPGKLRTATLAGGCFWGVQGVFQHVKGVTQAVSGYAGGTRETANYNAVGRGRTGHAEAVKITYDPAVIRYDELLQIYFSVAHDPTELNRQGPDTGTQYRSTVFPQDAEQERVTRDYIAQLDGARVFGRGIATTIETGKAFYPAEAYHQDFLARHPDHPYIAINDAPKVRNLERMFPAEWRAQPVLVGVGANVRKPARAALDL